MKYNKMKVYIFIYDLIETGQYVSVYFVLLCSRSYLNLQYFKNLRTVV